MFCFYHAVLPSLSGKSWVTWADQMYEVPISLICKAAMQSCDYIMRPPSDKLCDLATSVSPVPSRVPWTLLLKRQREKWTKEEGGEDARCQEHICSQCSLSYKLVSCPCSDRLIQSLRTRSAKPPVWPPALQVPLALRNNREPTQVTMLFTWTLLVQVHSAFINAHLIPIYANLITILITQKQSVASHKRIMNPSPWVSGCRSGRQHSEQGSPQCLARKDHQSQVGIRADKICSPAGQSLPRPMPREISGYGAALRCVELGCLSNGMEPASVIPLRVVHSTLLGPLLNVFTPLLASGESPQGPFCGRSCSADRAALITCADILGESPCQMCLLWLR